MYDDLLGKRPEKKKKPRLRTDLNAKPADPDKHPSHESARNTSSKDDSGHGSVSSCSDGGSTGHSTCEGDCIHCDDDGCEADDCPAPTPKDPWADVTPGPSKDDDDDGVLPDLEFIGWEDDDCSGNCDDCDDEECKGIDNMLGDFFEDEDEDAEGSWVKGNDV